jgi:hypothetical protein
VLAFVSVFAGPTVHIRHCFSFFQRPLGIAWAHLSMPGKARWLQGVFLAQRSRHCFLEQMYFNSNIASMRHLKYTHISGSHLGTFAAVLRLQGLQV